MKNEKTEKNILESENLFQAVRELRNKNIVLSVPVSSENKGKRSLAHNLLRYFYASHTLLPPPPATGGTVGNGLHGFQTALGQPGFPLPRTDRLHPYAYPPGKAGAGLSEAMAERWPAENTHPVQRYFRVIKLAGDQYRGQAIFVRYEAHFWGAQGEKYQLSHNRQLMAVPGWVAKCIPLPASAWYWMK